MKPEQLGPYRIGRKLGRGGMGTVYEGTNLETGEPAAVKVLSAALGQEPDFRHRFETEIETLRKLNHPNIVRLFGFGQHDEQLFYAMELVDGTSFEEELRGGRRFDWREVTNIGIDICHALRHAHDRGIIHRDIKPANLLVTREGQVKLSDFGIARLFGNARVTSAGSVMGTVEYMAPEQADARPVDPRTDLYSLGAVLFALLAGRPPLVADSIPEMLGKQRYELPEPVGKFATGVPDELQQIIAQLLEKEPDARVPNAMLLARRLRTVRRALSLAEESSDTGFGLEGPDGPKADIASADIPATRALSGEFDEQPVDEPAPDDSAPNDAELPETRHTDAFRQDHPDVDSDDQPQVVEPPKPSGHFTAIDQDELDRIEIPSEPRAAWVSPHTWVLALALMTVGLTVWYFLQPPSADRLYDRISSRAANGFAGSLRAAEDDIREFQVRFPRDSRTGQLREYEREIELRRLQNRFDRRIKGVAGSERQLPIERDYLEAMRYLKLDPELGATKLQSLIDLYDHRTDMSGPTGRCLELARRQLRQVRQQLDESAPDRLLLVQGRLDRADKLDATDPAMAKAMREAVVELYQRKPWAVEAVSRAKAALSAENGAVEKEE